MPTQDALFTEGNTFPICRMRRLRLNRPKRQKGGQSAASTRCGFIAVVALSELVETNTKFSCGFDTMSGNPQLRKASQICARQSSPHHASVLFSREQPSPNASDIETNRTIECASSALNHILTFSLTGRRRALLIHSRDLDLPCTDRIPPCSPCESRRPWRARDADLELLLPGCGLRPTVLLPTRFFAALAFAAKSL